jgi:putative transposase
MPYRKVKLVKGEMYHIYSRSIANFVIFNNGNDYARMKDEFMFYSSAKTLCNFSAFRKLKETFTIEGKPRHNSDPTDRIVGIIAYCIMPTHVHLILKEIRDDGISKFMESILKSYSKYFNIRHHRKGPLWESRFDNILVKDDEQFMHLTRYVHLNPVTAYLVDKPADWEHSSYKEYLGLVKNNEGLCSFSNYFNMDAASYEKFVHDQIGYQRSLAALKKITFSESEPISKPGVIKTRY